MKKLLWITLLGAWGLFATAAAQTESSMTTTKKSATASPSRILVVAFSATGTTAEVAERLAATTGGRYIALQAAVPYASADLDWHDRTSRSSTEMNDPSSRPALGGETISTEGCEVLFVGYPIWWNEAPRIINTFLETHDLEGIRLIPFATSGGSGITNSVSVLQRTYPTLHWERGRLLNRADDGTLRSWTESLGL